MDLSRRRLVCQQGRDGAVQGHVLQDPDLVVVLESILGISVGLNLRTELGVKYRYKICLLGAIKTKNLVYMQLSGMYVHMHIFTPFSLLHESYDLGGIRFHKP
jgi:hypothetical protein